MLKRALALGLITLGILASGCGLTSTTVHTSVTFLAPHSQYFKIGKRMCARALAHTTIQNLGGGAGAFTASAALDLRQFPKADRAAVAAGCRAAWKQKSGQQTG